MLARTSSTDCDLLARRPPGRRDGCIPLPPDEIKDPDPATYCQQLLLETGNWPSFNSPDLDTVFLWPVSPIDALTVTLRNLSADASAAGTRVELSWSPWGIGLPRTPISSGTVDLARSGFPGAEQKLSLATPKEVKDAGRYGIFAELTHPYECNRRNNRGEQTVDGFQTSSGRAKTFVVPVANPLGQVANVELMAGPGALAAWASIAPAAFTLAPGAQTNVAVEVAVPAAVPVSPPGTLISATVDILARANGQFIGGVSILILLDG